MQQKSNGSQWWPGQLSISRDFLLFLIVITWENHAAGIKWIVGKHATKHPTKHRTAPRTKMPPASNANGAGVEKSSHRATVQMNIQNIQK
jgi:hypothetical protein